MNKHICIIGAGPAGISVVETLRSVNKSSKVTVLNAEPFPPYSPPAMIDHFLTGSNSHLWKEKDWPEAMDIDYRSGVSVTALMPQSHLVRLDSGETIGYDQLVIASGSRLYAPLPGADLPGVYNFKSLSAAEELMSRVRSGEAKTALVVGAGFIGMEIALLLCDLGLRVTQVEMLDTVMSGMLDQWTATFALKEIQQRGVEVRLQTKAKAFIGDDRMQGVELESGQVFLADVLIAATGVRPNLDFIAGSGIEHRWGLVVNQELQTSHPDIYAAGDVIEAPDRLTGQPYVHAIFPNAVEQGRVVGLNLAGIEAKYEGAERMNSLKHLGLPIMAVGMKESDEILRSRVNGGWRTLYIQENRLVGYQLVGDIAAAGALRQLFVKQVDLGKYKEHLLEPGFSLGMLTWASITQ